VHQGPANEDCVHQGPANEDWARLRLYEWGKGACPVSGACLVSRNFSTAGERESVSIGV